MICKEKIAEHKLEMDLVEARYLFDRSKLMFYFTAEDRIDFRDLVKDLAAIFKTRIELRQIGVRDQVKRLGGNGPCGRELCCCSFLSDFDTVSIKMAKEQNLSLNASKITGLCGRLMCCLRYEQNVYDDKMKKLPHVGAIVKTEDGEGTVDQVEVLKEIIRVKLQDENENFYYKRFNAADVKIIKDNKRKASNDENTTEEELAELKRIEAMDKYDNKNRTKDDDV
jgi:cell fate regulator YaaT (PSP1 superfamily)